MAIREDSKIINVQKLHFYKDLLKTKQKGLIITDINEIDPTRTLTLRTVRSTKIDNSSAIKSEQDLETDEFRCFRLDLFTITYHSVKLFRSADTIYSVVTTQKYYFRTKIIKY